MIFRAAAAAAKTRVLVTILLILHTTSTSLSWFSLSSGEVILKTIEKVDIKKGLDEAKRLLAFNLQELSGGEQLLLEILAADSPQDRDELLESLRDFHDRLSSLGESLEAVELRVERTVEKLRGKVAHFEELKRVDGPDGASIVMGHICGAISSPLGSKMDKETRQAVGFALRDFEPHYSSMHQLFPSFGAASMKKSEGEEVECLSFGEEQVVKWKVLNYLKSRLRFDAILSDKQSKEVQQGSGGLSEEDRQLIRAMILETIIIVLLLIFLSLIVICLVAK